MKHLGLFFFGMTLFGSLSFASNSCLSSASNEDLLGEIRSRMTTTGGGGSATCSCKNSADSEAAWLTLVNSAGSGLSQPFVYENYITFPPSSKWYKKYDTLRSALLDCQALMQVTAGC